jgi:protein gp37
MGDRTRIESSDASWNPTYGCSVVSQGCRNCYARRIAAHSAKPGQIYYGIAKYSALGPRWTGKLVHATAKTREPLMWKERRMIAVDTMSDLFHPRIADAWRDEAYGVMALCPQHIFQVLTKRPQIMERYFAAPDVWARIEAEARRIYAEWKKGKPYPSEGHLEGPLPNVWHGVSVESQSAATRRVPVLLRVPSYRHYVAAEPLLGPLNLTHWLKAGIGWVLVSGEGGPDARPCDVEWIRALVEQARDAGVPIFVKQLGSATNFRSALHTLRAPLDTRTPRGSEIDEWPEALRVRQIPEAA